MDWRLAAERIKKAQEKNDHYSVHFEQVRTESGGYTSDFECPLCKEGLFGRSIVVEIGLYNGSHVMLCITCGALSGPWIKGDFGW